MKNSFLLLYGLLVGLALSYIDIDLSTGESASDVLYNMPLTLGSNPYHIAVSLQNHQEYIVAPSALKSHKKGKKDIKNATMHVSSLQGYTLQGWKRFFAQTFFFIDSRYSHTISIDLSTIHEVKKSVPLTNGLMTLGPQMSKNKIYGLIKAETMEFFEDDIVSLFATPSGNEVKMQLGGHEAQNARGYNNGIRFYQQTVQVSDDGKQWLFPVLKLIIAKERGRKWDTFVLPHSQMSPKLTIQSRFIVLPEHLMEDLELSFESESIDCSFAGTSRQLQCTNISSVDEALTFVSFNVEENVNINVSLYDLRQDYNSKSKVTSFYLKLGTDSELQIGTPILRGYYISLNMNKKTIMFSPVNRFTPEITTVVLLRFAVMFLLFMLGACVVIVIWQMFNGSGNRHMQFRRGKEGVRLVAYQRPKDYDDEDDL